MRRVVEGTGKRAGLPAVLLILAAFVAMGRFGHDPRLYLVGAVFAAVAGAISLLPSTPPRITSAAAPDSLVLLRAASAPADSPLHDPLDAAARLAGVAAPPLHVVDTPLPNAFVLPDDEGVATAVGVTTGLAGALSPAELTAVFLDLLVRRPEPDTGTSLTRRDPVPACVTGADLAAARLLPDPAPLVSALQKVMAVDHCLWWADLGPSVYLSDRNPFAPRPRTSQRVLDLREALGMPDGAVPPPDPQPAYTREDAEAFVRMLDPGYDPARRDVRLLSLPRGVNQDAWRAAVIRARPREGGPDIVIPEAVDTLGGPLIDLLADVAISEGGARVERPLRRITQQERMDELDARRRSWLQVAGERVAALLEHDAFEGARGLAGAAEGDRLPATRRALEGLSLAAGLPTPAMRVLETSAVNAFLVARDDVVVGVTRGLTATLSLDEQRAVLADLLARLDLSHLRAEEDAAVQTRVEAADLAAVRLLGDPAPLLSAISLVWAAPHVVQAGWELGPWVWFFHDGPFDGTPGLVEHPRVRRLRQVLGVAGAGPQAG